MIKKFLITSAAVVLLVTSALIFFFPLPGQAQVLMYHFIATDEIAKQNKNFVSRKSFERQMFFLNLFGYRVISLAELEANRNGTRKPKAREVAITFDDGHISFLTEGFPVLNKYQFPVTLFIVSEQVQSGASDRLSISMLRSLTRNSWIDIESHTQTHPVLSKLPTEEIRREVADSKKDLEKIFEKKIDYLAYPVGDIDSRVLEEAEKAGYHMAFTTSFKKLKDLPEGTFSMQRQKISRSSDNPIVFWFKLSGLYQSFKRFRHFNRHPGKNT